MLLPGGHCIQMVAFVNSAKGSCADMITCCRRCQVRRCAEEGVLVTDSARAHLEACTITACRGPALDASLRARLSAADCSFTGCVGAPAWPPLPSGTRHARCLEHAWATKL